MARNVNKWNTNLFERGSAMANDSFVRVGEGFPVWRQERADIFRQAGMVPWERLRELREAGLLEYRVSVDPTALTAFFAQNTLIGATDSLSLGAAVIG